MANPTRKDAETTAKKKRTSTRKTKKKSTPQVPTSLSPTPPKETPTPTIKISPPSAGDKPKSPIGLPKIVIPKGGSGGSGNNSGLSKSIQVLDIQGLAAGDAYAPLANIPEMSKKDALKIQTQLAKQQNALDVRYERAKTLRKGIKVATEEQNAATDAINFEAAVLSTETAFINYQSTVINRDIASSKLEENQEKLIQQQNSTAHTIAMTPLLDEENQLSLTKQQLKNDKLRLDIEQTRNNLALQQNELDAMVIDI